MFKIFCAVVICFMLAGCGGTGTPGTDDSYVSCTDAVAYVSMMDAAIVSLPAALPDNEKEVAMAKAWYLVARSGAVAYIAKKCPEILPSLPGAPA